MEVTLRWRDRIAYKKARSLLHRYRWVLIAFTFLILGYVGSYYVLSRHGIDDAHEMYGDNPVAFTYLDPREVDEETWYRWEPAIVYLFIPINTLDRDIFGTLGANGCWLRLE